MIAGFILAITLHPAVSAPPTTRESSLAHLDEQIRPFLAQHCLKCHSGDKPKGDFRIDQLTADFVSVANRDRWTAAIERVRAGEMPPEDKPQPTAQEVQAIAAWVTGRVHLAETQRRATQGRVVLRRLNRVEYENTLRDLLGVPVHVKEILPADSAAGGFDNVGSALHTSSFLMERYLEAADKALSLAITNRPKPPAVISKRIRLTETHQVKSTTERVYRKADDGAVTMFSSSNWQNVTVSGFYPPDGGLYRWRIKASATQSDGKPVVFRVLSGGGGVGGVKADLIGYFDAPAGEPAIIEFVDEMDPKTTISILPYGLATSHVVNPIGADNYTGPGLTIEYVEVEGPLHESWPPQSHRRIFGDLPQASSPAYNQRDRVEVTSKDPQKDAARIVRDFARRAFRRAVTEEELKPILDLVQARLDEKYSFEQAVRVGLQAVLVSPQFLFLNEKPGKLDDFALASRLSYFLWSSTPDEPLLAAAEAGKLQDPAGLREQVERMLKDPKAAAFTENFVGQWLGLRDIDFTMPTQLLYPEYDEMLKVSMVREAELFFAELLRDDLSLNNFIASDFTMLNGRLAKHYGIPGVEGWAFKKTPLPPDSHRGGVMTMAAVLKVTANGTNTSPVMRGAWVLDRLLGAPPPPPPESIAALEPDIRGALTIRDQLAKHRQLESCASCHVRIDPPGFALESFDVIGGWRDRYRTRGRGDPVTIDGKKMNYLHGLKVDPSDRLPDGRAFRDIDELKQLLLADKDQVARNLTIRLATYATGGVPEFADQAEIEGIVGRVRQKNYGFRSLVHEVVASELFRKK